MTTDIKDIPSMNSKIAVDDKDLERWRKEDRANEAAHRKLRRDIVNMFPDYSVVLETHLLSINAVTLIASDGREITFGLSIGSPEYVHLAIAVNEKE